METVSTELLSVLTGQVKVDRDLLPADKDRCFFPMLPLSPCCCDKVIPSYITERSALCLITDIYPHACKESLGKVMIRSEIKQKNIKIFSL